MLQTRGIKIPFVSFGKVTSNDLFEEREQVAFDFYERNKDRYHYVLDVGANIGVHALMMAKQGWQVCAFEPDPEHCKRLYENTQGTTISILQAALSYEAGDRSFTRVLDNTTANHLTGSREHHGATEVIEVQTYDCLPWFQAADFAKVDIEGHEGAMLCRLPQDIACEIMVEIGSVENAKVIYYRFRRFKPLWRQVGSQWKPVQSMYDMPTHYKDGALFMGEM